MKITDEAPQLPKLPFFAGDAVLLLAALLIAEFHPHPSAPLPLVLIVGCIALGVVLATIPFLADYARLQEQSARELRAALEAQRQRLAEAAAQLDSTVSRLSKIEDAALQNVQTAEKLPALLQARAAEFKQQLSHADDAEKKSLARELAALRAASLEKLESAAEKIQQTVAAAAALETSLGRQIAAAQEAAAKVPAALDQTLAQTRAALAAFDEKLAALRAGAALPAPSALAETPAPAEAAEPSEPPRPARKRAPKPAAPEPPPAAGETPASAAAAETPSETPLAPAAAPEPAAAPSPEPATPEKIDAPHADPAPAPDAEPGSAPKEAKPPRKRHAPKPPAAASTELSLELENSAAASHASSAPADTASEKTSVPQTEAAAPAEFSQLPPDDATESARSADGATRLLVTAYIGIGNKLHLRGEGPGLSWDKGVPLTFVSIGKWRWESADASAPVKGRLLKNDEIESPLGLLTLVPGQQLAVTATF